MPHLLSTCNTCIAWDGPSSITGATKFGKASLLKLIGNTFIINMIETLAEGHVLAEKTELGAANLEKFLEVVFPGPFMIHSKRMSTGAYCKIEVGKLYNKTFSL